MDYEYGEYALDENVELEEEFLQFNYGEPIVVNQQQTVQIKTVPQRHPQQVQQQRQVTQQRHQQVSQQQHLQLQQQQRQQQQQQQLQQQQELKSYYENKAAADEKKIYELQSQYNEALKKYSEARQEITNIKNKKNDEVGAREKIKQLEDRVTLIKTKAKEKIDEKEATITELNGKIKNYEEMLAMLEVNCKEAVVKFNDFQQEIAKKEEIIQQHFAFKNRYDYTVNYLTEKCQFITDRYEKKIRDLEAKLENARSFQTQQPQEQTSSIAAAPSEPELKMETSAEETTTNLEDRSPPVESSEEKKDLTEAETETSSASAATELPEISSPEKSIITLAEAIDELENSDDNSSKAETDSGSDNNVEKMDDQ